MITLYSLYGPEARGNCLERNEAPNQQCDLITSGMPDTGIRGSILFLYFFWDGHNS